MKRLTLSLLLAVFCLALLAIPANAGRYDPRLPSPAPSINMTGDDGAAGADIPWVDPTRKLVIPAPIEEQSMIERIGLFCIRFAGNSYIPSWISISPVHHDRAQTIAPNNKMDKR
jgi:hypothetical protein